MEGGWQGFVVMALTAKKEVERNKQSVDLHVDSLSERREVLKSGEIGRQ